MSELEVTARCIASPAQSFAGLVSVLEWEMCLAAGYVPSRGPKTSICLPPPLVVAKLKVIKAGS